VALIRTDVSEDRIASIFRVHECEQVTERSCKLFELFTVTETVEKTAACMQPNISNGFSSIRIYTSICLILHL
jgi:hypothetical protein